MWRWPLRRGPESLAIGATFGPVRAALGFTRIRQCIYSVIVTQHPNMTRHYNRAPIAEAVIDLRVEWPADAPADVFERVAEQLKARLPKSTPVRAVEMGFHQAAGQEPSFVTGAQVVGQRLDSASGDRVLQIQRAGFSYSHLPPYSDWDTFSAEAGKLWQAYVDAAGIKTVIRAAVRVINKIVLPGSLQDFPKYTNLHPQIPAGMLSAPDAYFLQLQSAGAVEGSRVILNSGRTRLPDDKWEFLLDFDLFTDCAIDARSKEIWTLLKGLSDAKNDLFEACITNDFRRLIE